MSSENFLLAVISGNCIYLRRSMETVNYPNKHGFSMFILGPLIPLFWISGNISSGFQSHSGLPYSQELLQIHIVFSIRSSSRGN